MAGKRMTSNHINIFLWLSILIPVIRSIGTTLSGTISTNFTFTVAGSPYNITSTFDPVIFESTSHVIIENGAQIGFTDQNSITIRGSINCGCYDGVINKNINTALFKNSGLADNTIYSHLYAINPQSQSSWGVREGEGIVIETTGNSTQDIQICNTKFSNLQYGIYFKTSATSNVLVDNCVFDGLYYAMFLMVGTNYETKMADSFITRTEWVSKGAGGIIFDNIEVNQFNGLCTNNQFSLGCIRIAVRNSRFSKCVESNCRIQLEGYQGDGINAFVNNTFSNVTNVVQISDSELNAGLVIRDNIFENIGGSIIDVNSNGISIINNRFYASSKNYGIIIYADNLNDTLIENNKFVDNDFVGAISILAIGGVTHHNVTIANNEFVNNGIDMVTSTMIEFIGGTINGVHIEHNTFINNTLRGHCIGVHNYRGYLVTIANNKFIDNIIDIPRIDFGGLGLIVMNANGVYYENNLFENNIVNNSDQVIYQQSGDMIFFQHNILINNRLRSIRSYASIFRMSVDGTNVPELSIKYNSFKSNATISSMADFGNYTYIFISHAVKSVIQYNNFDDYDKLFNFVDGAYGTTTATNNYFGGIIEPFSIDNKLHDACDFTYASSRIAFSPWYYERINFNDLSNLPLECSFTRSVCTYNYYDSNITYYNYMCDGITSNPSVATTRSPTTTTTAPSKSQTPTQIPSVTQSGLDSVISMVTSPVNMIGILAFIMAVIICCCTCIYCIIMNKKSKQHEFKYNNDPKTPITPSVPPKYNYSMDNVQRLSGTKQSIDANTMETQIQLQTTSDNQSYAL